MKDSKLFRVKDASERRSLTHKVRVTPDEDAQIRHAAAIRQLDVSDFYRRAALGRRADVAYEIDTVLILSDVVRSIRDFHAALVERGIAPPDDILRPAIVSAVDAMHRIEGR